MGESGLCVNIGECSFGLMEPVLCGGDVVAMSYESEAVGGQAFGAAVFASLT